MNIAFADTGYWIALLDSGDPLHKKTHSRSRALQPLRIVTSMMVLTELLNHFAGRGPRFRRMIVRFIADMENDVNLIVIPQSGERFHAALELYAQREDKAWGLTDCASFLIMREQNITQALAHDIHFRQAGFIPLLRAD